jgi:two-component system, LytTR family, response regulator LytT
MTILIIEDELEADKNLRRLIKNIEPTATILTTIDTVSEGIEWLNTQPHPDLILSDIQLSDGNSFEIFDTVKTQSPVIFVTAYDEYAIKAFSVHSIDYLLKPIGEPALRTAIEKYKSLKINNLSRLEDTIQNLFQQHRSSQKTYRRSFLVRYRDKMLPIKTEDFAFFYTKDDIVYGVTRDDKTYTIENSLEELEDKLDPIQFFRANRQFIVSRDALKEVAFYFTGRLSLKMQPLAFDKILVSKERVPVFKRWFEVI